MKRNALIAVVITAAALALSGPAFAKSGHGGGKGGGSSNGGGQTTQTKPPKPTIHPNKAVTHAIYCALRCGTIEDDGGVSGWGD